MASRRSSAFSAVRPQQWTKNLLLFAGIVFAAKLGDGSRWVGGGWPHSPPTALPRARRTSSTTCVDREADRAHPLKQSRPVARGDVRCARRSRSLRYSPLLALALAVCARLPIVALLGLFALLQAAYTVGLKHVVLCRRGSRSRALFVVRPPPGQSRCEVPISPWLLVCTGLLALFLALGKRRGELVARRVAGRAGEARPGWLLPRVPRPDRGWSWPWRQSSLHRPTRSQHTTRVRYPRRFRSWFGLFRYVHLIRRRGAWRKKSRIRSSLRQKPISDHRRALGSSLRRSTGVGCNSQKLVSERRLRRRRAAQGATAARRLYF